LRWLFSGLRKSFIRYEDLPLKAKTGKQCEVEFVSNLYDEDGRKVIQCNIWDITECKKGEEALRRAHAQLADRAGQLEQAVAERTTAHRTSTSARFMNALLQDLLAFSRLISRWSGEGDCLAPRPHDACSLSYKSFDRPKHGSTGWNWG